MASNRNNDAFVLYRDIYCLGKIRDLLAAFRTEQLETNQAIENALSVVKRKSALDSLRHFQDFTTQVENVIIPAYKQHSDESLAQHYRRIDRAECELAAREHIANDDDNGNNNNVGELESRLERERDAARSDRETLVRDSNVDGLAKLKAALADYKAVLLAFVTQVQQQVLELIVDCRRAMDDKATPCATLDSKYGQTVDRVLENEERLLLDELKTGTIVKHDPSLRSKTQSSTCVALLRKYHSGNEKIAQAFDQMTTARKRLREFDSDLAKTRQLRKSLRERMEDTRRQIEKRREYGKKLRTQFEQQRALARESVQRTKEALRRREQAPPKVDDDLTELLILYKSAR